MARRLLTLTAAVEPEERTRFLAICDQYHVSPSMMLRALIRERCSGRPGGLTFTEGWKEGRRAGYAAALEAISRAVRALQPPRD